MPDLLIKEKELSVFDQLLADVPYKHASPIVRYFQQLHATRQQETMEKELRENEDKENKKSELTSVPLDTEETN